MLARAEGKYDAFVTVDRNLAFQQNTVQYSFAVLILRAHSKRLADLRPLVPKLLEALPGARPGQVTWVEE